MRLLKVPGVFGPISDAWMLADALGQEQLSSGTRVLDLCSGSGVVAIRAAQLGASVTAVDISWSAVAAVRLNARLNRVHVEARRGELFGPVADEAFDVIVCNPPYVPSPEPCVPRQGRARAWAAGPDGRLVIDRICASAIHHLRPGGRLLVVHSSLNGVGVTRTNLADGGMHDVEIAVTHRGPLGPLMREQQQLGTISSSVETEDVVVIRAVAP
jgi:release factor glutamine methyltransferase